MTDDESSQDDTAAAQLAAEIRRLRRAAGLSQPELAQQIGYTRQYVSLAERIGRNLPSHDLVRALDSVLDASGSLLALRARAKAEQKVLREAHRRQPGRHAPYPILKLGKLPTGNRVGAADVDLLYRHTARLRRLDDVLGGADTYDVYAALAENTKRLLLDARMTGDESQRLRSLLAEHHQMAGMGGVRRRSAGPGSPALHDQPRCGRRGT